MEKEKIDSQHSPEETARLRDEAIKRMLNTPPQPHVKKVPKTRKSTNNKRD